MINNFKIIPHSALVSHKILKNIYLVPFIKKENSDSICIRDVFISYLTKYSYSLKMYIENKVLATSNSDRKKALNNLSEENKKKLKNNLFTHFENIINTDYNITDIIIDKDYTNELSRLHRNSYKQIVEEAFGFNSLKKYITFKTREHYFLVSDYFIATYKVIDGIVVDINPLFTMRIKKQYLNYFRSCVIANNPNIRDEIFEIWISDQLFNPKFATLKKHIREHPLFSTIKTVKKDDLFNDLFKSIIAPEVKSLKEQKELSGKLISEFVDYNRDIVKMEGSNIHIIS